MAGFQVDMSPLINSSVNMGNTYRGIGQQLGGAIQSAGNMYAQNKQQEQQQGAQTARNDLSARAMQGDTEAFQQLMTQSPQDAQKVAQYLQQQQQGQNVQDDRFTSKMAQETAGFVEQLHLAPAEQQEAMFNAAVGDDRYDIDEEDRAHFMDPSARKALVSQVKGEDYSNTFFGGGAGADSNFAPQVSAIQTDPETGQKYVAITDRNDGTVKRVDAKDAIGETLTQEQDRVFRGKSLDDARVISKESFKELTGVKKSIGTIDEAISAIDDKANTGYVDKWLPSFKESTQRLENAAQRMGLDVISATTFGALSEGELRLAMDTAMPSNMQPKDLRKWLTERKAAKTKLARELTKMSIQLGRGKTTMAEYLQGNATFGGDISDLSDEDLFK
tara:strand:- start:407 stop:1573 length:1167 start_codon:yes stop_codon:yes gene_type:complete